MILFADDTSLVIEVDDPNIAAEVLNSDLDKIKIIGLSNG